MRVANWQEALAEEFARAYGRRFRWGAHDCFQFIARCYRATTGDEKRVLFPPYRTKAQATAILESFGGARGILIHALGEPKPIAFAGQGDVVLIDMGAGLQPAACMGLNSYAPAARELAFRPTLQGLEAWTI